jgi:dethiobiotin synthetase
VIGFFVTGTDTGVGKTHVAVALTGRFRAQGLKVFAFKPIETGCNVDGRGRLLGDDQRLLSEAAGGWQTDELAGVYSFTLPAAPSVAAAAEGSPIDLDRVGRAAEAGSARADVTVVEGAGGWRVPISSLVDMAGLARQVGLPVIVVARATLGTINHSLLTIEAVQRDGCPLAGVVLSRRPADDHAMACSNAEEIAKRWSGRIVLLEQDATVLDLFHVKR